MNTENKIFLHFIEALKPFEFSIDGDPSWTLLCKNGTKKWFYLRVQYYNEVYYVYDILASQTLEIEPSKNRVENSNQPFMNRYSGNRSINSWSKTLTTATEWLNSSYSNWIETNLQIVKKIPFQFRKGIVPSAIVKHYYPDFNHLERDLGKQNSEQMIALVEKNVLKKFDAGIIENVTANTFFDYCKIAYQALGIKTEKSTGKELYRQLADGRHDGLLDIDANSQQEFADWIDGKHPLKSVGGHPWEIMRGGNTTNIQLRVERPNYGNTNQFIISIYPTGNGRLAEAIKIFLALHQKGLAIQIPNPERIRNQIVSMDNFGIIPEFDSLHRANQYFDKAENVNDVFYVSDFKQFKKQILPFVTWQPVDLIRPRLLKI